MATATLESRTLIQLADELQSLLRAGTPLGTGLKDASGRWNRSLQTAARNLGERLDQGMPLEEALRSSPELPSIFRSLVAAGVRTPRAADVLAAWTDSTRQLLALRETLTRGMMYPAIVVVIAYVLFIGLVVGLLPEFSVILADLNGAPPAWTAWAAWLRETVWTWSWAVPLGCLALWFVLRKLAGRNGEPVGGWAVFPFFRRMLRDVHVATASQLLASLMECEVPLPLALELSSDTLDSTSSKLVLRNCANQLRTGGKLPQTVLHDAIGAPPLWRALFASERDPRAVRAGLLQISEILSQRAMDRADLIGRALPVLLVLLIGGGAVVLYGIAVFGPMIQLWKRIGGAA